MAWGKKIIEGVEYDLSHLDTFTMDVCAESSGAPTFKVLVSFGSHCFTREIKSGDPLEHHIYDGKFPRCFCPYRTANSRLLPHIIRDAHKGRAYFTQDKNMLLVERLPELKGPYAVFFNVKPSIKQDIDVTLFVASAYEKPNLVPRLAAVPFVALIAKASKGHAPFKPQRLTKW